MRKSLLICFMLIFSIFNCQCLVGELTLELLGKNKYDAKNILFTNKNVSEVKEDPFVLNEDLTLKSIQYLDMLQEEASNQGDDMESLFTATQFIMAHNLSLLVNELFEHLGGLLEV